MATWTNTPIPVETRFWSRVQKGPGCWIWIGSRNPKGYGNFKAKKRTVVGAHRFSYELHHGAIPAGLCVLHDCDNPSCVNPAHLKAGTQKQNIQDASARGRLNRPSLTITHCKHGHEFTPANTFWRKGGGRKCRKCIRNLRVKFKRPVFFVPKITITPPLQSP